MNVPLATFLRARVARLAPYGWLAVDGFFLLSGIVLTHVYGVRR